MVYESDLNLSVKKNKLVVSEKDDFIMHLNYLLENTFGG